MPLSARVAWIGQPGGEHGFGVEWKARDAGGTPADQGARPPHRSMGGLPHASR